MYQLSDGSGRIDWQRVSAAMGRKPKACKNKYYATRETQDQAPPPPQAAVMSPQRSTPAQPPALTPNSAAVNSILESMNEADIANLYSPATQGSSSSAPGSAGSSSNTQEGAAAQPVADADEASERKRKLVTYSIDLYPDEKEAVEAAVQKEVKRPVGLQYRSLGACLAPTEDDDEAYPELGEMHHGFRLLDLTATTREECE